jgi:hypothetical protein
MVEEDDSHDFPPLIEFSDKPTSTIGFDAQPLLERLFRVRRFSEGT